MKTAKKYTVTPQPPRDDEHEWRVDGGSEPYTVRCNPHGWICSCPNWCKSPGGRRDMLRRDGGCKHIHMVRCFVGDHKFMGSLQGPACVRCGISEAEYEFHEYGPPDEPFAPDHRDY